MGIFDSFKENQIRRKLMESTGIFLSNNEFPGREGDFVKSLVLASPSFIVQDLLFFSKIDKEYLKKFGNILSEEKIKSLLALESIFLYLNFEDFLGELDGFFESFKMDVKKIKNQLEKLFERNNAAVYFKKLNSNDGSLRKMLDIYQEIFLGLVELNNDPAALVSFKMKKLEEVPVARQKMSLVIEAFRQENPDEIIE